MSRSYRLWWTVFAALVGLPQALAAPDPPTDPPPDRTVVVAPSAVNRWVRPTALIGRDELGNAARGLEGVVDDQPGLTVRRLGGLGRYSVVTIRGSTADQVAVLIDGIPLITAGGAPMDLSTVPTGPLAAVAIYRGFSPIVFGTSAIGGALDVRTRDVRTPIVELEAGGGAFGTRLARGFYGTGGERGGVGVALDYLGAEGDFRYRNDNGTAFVTGDDLDVDRQNNAFDRVSALAKAKLVLSDAATITFIDHVFHRDAGVPGLGLWETRRSRLRETRNLAGARLSLRLGGVDVSTTGFVAYERSAYSDPLGEIGLTAGDHVDESVVPGVILAARAALISSPTLQLVPTIAASYRFDDRLGAGTAGPSRHVFALAAGVDLDVKATATTLSATARYEGTTTADEPVTDGASYRFGLASRAIEGLELSATLTHSMRLPTLFELYGDTGFAKGNTQLRPERGTALDLGVTLPGAWSEGLGLVSADAHIFALFVDDLIQMVQNSQHVARPENVDRARILGAELGVRADLWRHLRARLAFTWLDAENASSIAARRGRQLPYRPRFQTFARLAGYHDVGTWAVGELSLGVTVEGRTETPLDHANLVVVPDRWLWGIEARADLFGGAWRVALDIHNVADGAALDRSGFPLPGRSFMARVRWTPDLRATDGEDAR